jgi:signal transduction histidine kinase/DNA-binding response OmpR family regulator
VRTCVERRGGELWFGTQGGGIAIWRGGRFESIGAAQKLAASSVRGLLEDDRGVIWAGTEGQGLARIELAEGAPAGRARVAHIRARDGLYDDVVHAVLADDANELWCSTNRGIFRVPRSALDDFAAGRAPRVFCTSYTEDDGMPNREANGGAQGAAIRARDGRLWFATQEGAVVVDPARARRSLPPPPAMIEELTARGIRLSGRSGAAQLPSDRRDFSIAYAGLSLRASRDLRFRYRLLPGSREWTEAGDRRTAYFTHIPAGTHTFEVTTSLPDADWNGPVARMTIRVAPRVWETWWFVGSLAALAALAGLAGVRLRERQLLARQRQLAAQVESATRDLVREKHETEQARLEAERSRDLAQRSLGTIEEQARELRELNDARTRFFANVSHEFRTPLTLTIGPLEDVLSGQHGEVREDTRPSLEMALRNSHRALRQVNQLLDMAKFEAGGMRLRVRALDLHELTSEVVRAFAPLAARRGVALELVPDAPHAPPSPRMRLHGDPALLEQVFANLVSNALRHTGTGGSVRLAIRTDGADSLAPFVHVRVDDTGQGIAPEDLEHIFERFYQAEGARSHGFPTTGIGLSLTQDIVHLHGGRIDVESAPGRGSAFTVSLPLGSAHLSPEQLSDAGPVAPAPAVPAVVAPDWRRELDSALATLEGAGLPPAPDTPDAEVAAERTTVLVVEDDAEVRGYLCQHLRPLFRVIEAVDGLEGLAAVREHTPDLVVSDVMMPHMDGHALCRAIKNDPDTDFVPVVLLTARASVEHRIEGLEGGADDYLAKPFHARELLARVNNLLALRRRLRERLGEAAPGQAAAASPAVLRPSAVEATSADEQFMNRLRAVLESHLGEEDFGVQALADAMAMDRSSLYRRLSETTGEGIEAMLRRFRLERAAQLLEARSGNVGEIAYAVGFKSVSHFCKTFRDRFGVTPGAWANGERGA